MSDLTDALNRHEASNWNNRLTKDSPITKAAKKYTNGTTAWCCVENHPNGLRITNMPGGPGDGMCYFTGQGNSHLVDCGFKVLVPVETP